MITKFCVKAFMLMFGIDVWRSILLIWKTILTCIVKMWMTWMAREGCQQVTGTESSSSGLSTACFPFPASTKKKKKKSHKEALVVPTATGKLRRSKLGRGRNGAPNYKVTRENQSPAELSWHWRPGTRETADQWVSLHGEAEEGGGEGKEEGEGGVWTGYCSEKSVPCCVQISPVSLLVDPVTCSDVLVSVFTCLYWLCARATPIRGSPCGAPTQCGTAIASLGYFFCPNKWGILNDDLCFGEAVIQNQCWKLFLSYFWIPATHKERFFFSQQLYFLHHFPFQMLLVNLPVQPVSKRPRRSPFPLFAMARRSSSCLLCAIIKALAILFEPTRFGKERTEHSFFLAS